MYIPLKETPCVYKTPWFLNIHTELEKSWQIRQTYMEYNS